MAELPRGLRNNNPGNIIQGGQPYKGEVVPSKDSRFRQFISIEWGYRALFHLLSRYIKYYKKNTIEKIISSWAPSSENNTEKYIDDVVKWTGISKNVIIGISDTEKLVKIAFAISRKENGIMPSQAEINAGLNLLLSGQEPPVENKKKS